MSVLERGHDDVGDDVHDDSNDDIDEDEDDAVDHAGDDDIGDDVEHDVNHDVDNDVDHNVDDDVDHDVEHDDEAPKVTTSGTLVTQDSVAWLADIRLIGENPIAEGVRRCYLSGRARAKDYGFASMVVGKDPVAPGHAATDIREFRMYTDEDSQEPTGPLLAHDSCLRVLERAFRADSDTTAQKWRKIFKADEFYGFDLNDDVVSGAKHGNDEGNNEEGERGEEKEPQSTTTIRRLDLDALFNAVSAKRESYLSCLRLKYGALESVMMMQCLGVQLNWHEVQVCERGRR